MKRPIHFYFTILPVFIFTSPTVFGQGNNQINFLSKNSYPVKSGAIENSLFDNDFYAKTFFLFGENHGSSLPQAIDLLLFKHLHEKAAVNYYIAEVDCIKAWMLNEYLKDGDTMWLNKVFASWKRDTAQWANQEYYNKFKKLHEYYKGNSPAGKFTILGIDEPQDYSLIYEESVFLTHGISFKKYRVYIDSLNDIALHTDEGNRNTLIEFSKSFLSVINDHEDFFKKIMKTRYSDFKQLITSLTFLGSGIERDSLMYQNLKSLIEINKLQGKKMYGFLGFFHCLQVGYNGEMPFAALLKEHNDPKEKIVSIQMYSLDSKAMIPYTGDVKRSMPSFYADQLLADDPLFPKDKRYLPYDISNDKPAQYVQGIGLLKEFSQPGMVTLFKLTGQNSPYNKTTDLAQVKGFQNLVLNDKDTKTTESFQYVLLFRNSKSAKPL